MEVVMRPRLLPDTHLLPSDRGVVISGPRHTAAFPLPEIHPWLERMRPFLDGRSSLDQLTADLPPQAAQHVRALVELLARKGFVRDATADLPHGLAPRVLARHAALIDFIAARADSPEHRFERYRDCAPLVVGSGRMASALVLALLGSGVAHVRLRLGGGGGEDEGRGGLGAATDVARLRACVALLRQEGGCFRYEQVGGDLPELPAGVGVGVVLLATDVFDPQSAEWARALAARGGARYGQVVGCGEHIVISTVGDPAGGMGAEAPMPVRAPSPYLGGPIAAVAANQLCLHLLRRVAGLDGADADAGADAGDGPAPVIDAAVLELATGRFLGGEAA
ncbi:hypothetical protein ABZ858_26750 [Streptomyces sp. NPDC047017]|uniref:hypothetical protein n=1 Tax=Streptomyces sp. NPDC047017 TaxID=3155024 RepID=UPI0033F4A03E